MLICIVGIASCDTGLGDESTATALSNGEIAGAYVEDTQPNNYMILNANGTLSAYEGRTAGTGTYTREGATITLVTDPKRGSTTTGKLDKNALILTGDSRWTKKAEVSDGEITGTYVNDKNQSITLNVDGTFSGQAEGTAFDGTYTPP